MGEQLSAAVPKLWKAMDAKRWSQGDLAEALGTTSSVVNRWLHGDRKPGRKYADRIEELLEIDVALWDAPPPPSFELHATDDHRAAS